MAVGAKAIRAGQAWVEILAEDASARRVLKRFQSHMNSWATSMNNLGRTLILPGLAVALPMLNTIKVFADFEQQMQRVKARVSDADVGFERLRKTAIALGKTNIFSPKEVASGMAELAQAENDTAAILERMPVILNFAAAAEISVAEAAKFASEALNVFNLKGSQLGHVTDIIVKGANDSLSSVQDMSAAFSYAAPSAALVGTSVHELVGVLAELAQKGIQGERAGTTLRGVMTALVDPTDDGGAALKRMGITAIDPLTGKFVGLTKIISQMQRAFRGVGGGQRLKMLGPVFDTRMITGMAALASLPLGQIEGRIAELFNTQGDAARMAATQIDSLKGEWMKLMNTLQAAQITLTEAVVTPLRNALVAVRIFVAGIDAWAAKNPALVKQLFALGAAIIVAGPALIALSLALKLVQFAFEPVFMAMTGLRIAIFAVGTAFKWLGKTLLAPIFKVLWKSMGWFFAKALWHTETLRVAFLKFFSAIGTGFMFLANNPIFLLGIALIAVAGYIIYMSDVWSKAVTAMKAAWGRFSEDVKIGWKGILDAIQSGRMDLAFEITLTLMEIAWLETVDFMKSQWDDFADYIVDIFDKASTSIAQMMTKIMPPTWLANLLKIFEIPDAPLQQRRGGQPEKTKPVPPLGKDPFSATEGGAGFGGGVAGMAANALAKGLAFGGMAQRVEGLNGLNPRGAGAPALLKAQIKQSQDTTKAQDAQSDAIDKRLKRADEAMPKKRGAKLTQFDMPLEDADIAADRQRQFRFNRRNPRESLEAHQKRKAAAAARRADRKAGRGVREENNRQGIGGEKRLPGDVGKLRGGLPDGFVGGMSAEDLFGPNFRKGESVAPQFEMEPNIPYPPGASDEDKLRIDQENRKIDRDNITGKAKFDRKSKLETKRNKLKGSIEQAKDALAEARGEKVGKGDRMGGTGPIDISGMKTSVSGTFNALAAGGMATGNTFGSRIANATEKTAKELEMLNKKGAGVGK